MTDSTRLNYTSSLVVNELVTDYVVSTQVEGKPTVFVSIKGPLSSGWWRVYTKRFFGLVHDDRFETNDLEFALREAHLIAGGHVYAI